MKKVLLISLCAASLFAEELPKKPNWETTEIRTAPNRQEFESKHGQSVIVCYGNLSQQIAEIEKHGGVVEEVQKISLINNEKDLEANPNYLRLKKHLIDTQTTLYQITITNKR